ncbi:hypothetical protein GWI33_018922 [Rhynchophorus ferrugineus]|uniref:Uncharacterized protein n=1 Tax=Rhynchophorus ferrugineus TaxID=354439 RepID=A0A834HVF6_RHYFE|nr:hypothetical protein GWI33_018922 [Rhynchophorus ferrugineus]
MEDRVPVAIRSEDVSHHFDKGKREDRRCKNKKEIVSIPSRRTVGKIALRETRNNISWYANNIFSGLSPIIRTKRPNIESKTSLNTRRESRFGDRLIGSGGGGGDGGSEAKKEENEGSERDDVRQRKRERASVESGESGEGR